jgi:hypothetical protein
MHPFWAPASALVVLPILVLATLGDSYIDGIQTELLMLKEKERYGHDATHLDQTFHQHHCGHSTASAFSLCHLLVAVFMVACTQVKPCHYSSHPTLECNVSSPRLCPWLSVQATAWTPASDGTVLQSHLYKPS